MRPSKKANSLIDIHAKYTDKNTHLSILTSHPHKNICTKISDTCTCLNCTCTKARSKYLHKISDTCTCLNCTCMNVCSLIYSYQGIAYMQTKLINLNISKCICRIPYSHAKTCIYMNFASEARSKTCKSSDIHSHILIFATLEK